MPSRLIDKEARTCPCRNQKFHHLSLKLGSEGIEKQAHIAHLSAHRMPM
uniref:Uncharacterized protein n=1 Tax=Rhizophora mucronata TaxID=61149 RepID=A0A2P2JET7_RHIMU